jgi:hypothetical protein
LGTIAASGNRITVSGMVIFRLVDGKVAEGRFSWDRVESAGTLHVTFLLNFFDEVRRRVRSEKRSLLD